MKTLISSILLLGTFAVNAEVVTVKLPKAGTFLVTALKAENCTPTDYTLGAIERDASYRDGKMSYSLNVETTRIVNLFGSTMECRTGMHTGTGVFAVTEATELKINLTDGLEDSRVIVSEVVETKPVR